MSTVLFQMPEHYRENIIAEHRFYVDQAKKRLLAQFALDKIKEEANQAADAYLESMSTRYNPDIHDPADCYERAGDKRDEFYQLVCEMHETTRLSVIAGIYHQWDKRLRDWMVREIAHWHRGEKTVDAVWKASFIELMAFWAAMGFDVKALPCYDHLNAMRLLVNVFKHGAGGSCNELREAYPAFFDYPLSDFGASVHALDYAYVKATDVHLNQFSVAILEFWKAVPDNIYLRDDVDVPAWFERARLKDQGNQ